MRENQFQDSHRLCKGTKDALIENFTNSFAEEVARPPSGEGVDRYENATTPQLFASNEASRDIFQPVRHSLSGKGCLVVPEIGVGEREGWKSIERGKRERERERRIEMAIHAPINGIRCRRNGVTRSGHVLHDDAKCELLCFQEKKKNAVGEACWKIAVVVYLVLFLSSIIYYRELQIRNWNLMKFLIGIRSISRRFGSSSIKLQS